VTIEFTNAIEPRSHASVSVAIVVAACAFFFIPTTLIVLGYYTSQPTGSLISPLPQGILSNQTGSTTPVPTNSIAETSLTRAPLPAEVVPTATPENAPIIAAPNESTESAEITISPEIANNIIDRVATVPVGTTEELIEDVAIKSSSQIYLSPRMGDKAIYSVKSKEEGRFTITASPASDTIRYVDYQIVNP
jgi:hypothetical protein